MILKMPGVEVEADRLHGARVFFHQRRGGRSPAEGFDPEAAASGKQIEHAGSEDLLPQAVENGSLDAVHRGPQIGLGRDERDSPGNS